MAMENRRKQASRLMVIMLCCCALSACSSGLFRYFETGPAGYSVLDYYRWVSTAGQAALEGEVQRLRGLAEDGQDLVAAVQLALVYSVPEQADVDAETAAMTLLSSLQTVSGSGRIAEYLDFAQIWQGVLEQRRQLREAQQARSELQQQVLQADERNRSLQEQIEALTTIEQQLIEREQLQEQP